MLIHEDAVLVTDEHRGGVQMTKFPGGGLEMGEGLANGLIREFDEELNIAITVKDFFTSMIFCKCQHIIKMINY